MKYALTLLIITLCYCCSAMAQTPEQIRTWLPVVEGWNISDKVEVFNPDNLFNRINGSAPLFLENNFREMTALEYTRGDDYITIQVYRHASPEDTFGMYASERSSELSYFPIGGEAQGDDTNIYFFAGCLYVKMWASAQGNVGAVLQDIAKRFAVNIDPKAGYPAILKAFPAGDKVEHSEAYITSNYLGHEFLKGVYTANYTKDGHTFQVFVIDAKASETARKILAEYYAFCKQTVAPQEGFQTINDRYNGDIPFVLQGRYLAGVYSEERNSMPGAEIFLKDLLKRVE